MEVFLHTGYHTGSIYHSPQLTGTFPGEGKKGGMVIIIKTHKPYNEKHNGKVKVGSCML